MNSTYIGIQTLDYKGQDSLSGYTLPGSEFTFIPNLADVHPVISLQNIVWDFGDGTSSNNLTATHSYAFPGIYTVRIIAYNQQGQPIYGSYTPQITAYDYINDILQIDSVTPYSTRVDIKAGQFQQFLITRQNSWRSVPANNNADFTVIPYASGASSPLLNLETYYTSQWSHLIRNCRFLNKQSAGYSVEYAPISAINTTSTLIYVNTDSNGTYKVCSSDDSGAILAGSTGYAAPYFTSDQPQNLTLSGESPVILFFTLDSSKLVDQVTIGKDLSNIRGINYINQGPTVVPSVYIRYNPAAGIQFTTNGIGTQSDALLSTFNIPAISWQHTKIPFIARLVDDILIPTKFYPTLSAGNTSSNYILHLSAVSNNQLIPGTFYTDWTSAAPTDIGGYFRGYFISPISALSVQFIGEVSIADPSYYSSDTNSIVAAVTSRSVTGASNLFNILSSNGVYNIAKINEDFDFGSYLGNLRFSEYLYNYTEFFDKFLPAFAGNTKSKPYELGKVIFEKISNFVDNNSNVDTANVQALISMCNELGYTLEDINYEYPAQLRRIVDILSIKHKKLYGDINSYSFDFNNHYSSSPNFAKNLGAQLDPLTGTFTVGSGIVAFETFSGTYTLVYTAQLSSYPIGSTLPISAYNSSWGWPLLLPATVSGIDVTPHYNFYQYIPTPAGNIVDSVINWNDPTVTLSYNNSSYSDWSADDGIMDNIINYEFVKGLRLFTSAADITYNN